MKRLEKTRATLPTGYQYGDAAPSPAPTFADPTWPAYFAERYIQPIHAMFADPIAYAAYRVKVDKDLTSPAERARAADVDRIFQRLTR